MKRIVKCCHPPILTKTDQAKRARRKWRQKYLEELRKGVREAMTAAGSSEAEIKSALHHAHKHAKKAFNEGMRCADINPIPADESGQDTPVRLSTQIGKGAKLKNETTMTQVFFHDLEALGRKIQEYTRELANYRALIEGREMLAKGLRSKYPNMKIEAIRDTLWKQEQEQAKKAQTAFNEMRMYAESCEWSIDHKEVTREVVGTLRFGLINLNDINV